MPKLLLDLNDDIRHQMIGFSSPLPAYRICWELNRKLKLDFKRLSDFIEDRPSGRVRLLFERNFSICEDQITEYWIVKNLSGKNQLFRELQHCDYILLISCGAYDPRMQNALSALKSIRNVLHAELVATDRLKNENLIPSITDQ